MQDNDCPDAARATPHTTGKSSPASSDEDPVLTALLSDYRQLLAERAGLDRRLDELEFTIMESEPLNAQALKAIRTAFAKSLQVRHGLDEGHPMVFALGGGGVSGRIRIV